MTETQQKMLDRRQESRNETSKNIFRLLFFLMCETTSVSPLLVFEDRDLKKGIVESWDSFVVEYLLKLVDNLRLKCFWAHWATSSRHGPLFTQQCYSPTRCYGKFGSHNGLDSSGEGYYLAVVSPVWPLKFPPYFKLMWLLEYVCYIEIG